MGLDLELACNMHFTTPPRTQPVLLTGNLIDIGRSDNGDRHMVLKRVVAEEKGELTQVDIGCCQTDTK